MFLKQFDKTKTPPAPSLRRLPLSPDFFGTVCRTVRDCCGFMKIFQGPLSEWENVCTLFRSGAFTVFQRCLEIFAGWKLQWQAEKRGGHPKKCRVEEKVVCLHLFIPLFLKRSEGGNSSLVSPCWCIIPNGPFPLFGWDWSGSIWDINFGGQPKFVVVGNLNC